MHERAIPNSFWSAKKYNLRLLDTNFESLENLMMLYIVRKVLASLEEFSNADDATTHEFCHKKGSCKNRCR